MVQMWFGSPHLQIDRDGLKTFSTTNRTPTYLRRYCLPWSSSRTKTVNKNCTLKKKNMALFTAGPAITCWDRGRLVKEKNSGRWTSHSTGLGTQGLVCNLPHPVIKQKTWQSNIIGHSHSECRSKHLTEFAALPQNVKKAWRMGNPIFQALQMIALVVPLHRDLLFSPSLFPLHWHLIFHGPIIWKFASEYTWKIWIWPGRENGGREEVHTRLLL